jgi:glycosyltransferase involved in cell wall biosynthesis
MFEKENPFYGENFWRLERQIDEMVAQLSPFAVMLESIDEQLFLLAKEKARWPRTRLVGVSHQPPAWWRLNHARPDIVSALDLLVVVASTVRPYWEQFLDKKRIRVIPHGVDVEFFFPSESERKLSSGDEDLRVVFCGQWLRDFETMRAVVANADQLNLPLHFEMVVPRQSRGNEACYRMAMSHRVRWHSDLTDEDLRSVYRHSDLLLLPLLDSTANNGLLEGMACGLPVIVTDVGGVRDYAKENFADFVLPGDASGIIKILQGYLNRRDKLAARGRAARAYAEDHHSWRKIAGEYITALQTLD